LSGSGSTSSDHHAADDSNQVDDPRDDFVPLVFHIRILHDHGCAECEKTVTAAVIYIS
jgi:hypothetical protein